MKSPFLLWLLVSGSALAGSATWNLSPTSSDWSLPSNWTPSTVPNGPSDIATFAVSNQLAISITSQTEVGEIDFASGGNLFEITINPAAVMTISGAGMVNSSGLIQKLTVTAGSSDAELVFTNLASAGESTRITNADSGANPGVARTQFSNDSSAGATVMLNEGATVAAGTSGVSIFSDSSSAGDATITNTGGAVSGATGGTTFFLDHSTAARAIFANLPGVAGSVVASAVQFADRSTAGTSRFTNFGGRTANAPGTGVSFTGRATAANSTIVNNGGETLNAGGGYADFLDTSTADNSALIANGGIAGGQGASFNFFANSSGGTARVTLYGDSVLSISEHNSPGMKIGSLEGTGLVILGANRLTLGSNNLDTTFSGVIDDSGLGGSLRKIGVGGLVLTGANTYSGGTSVNRGTLIINNTIGSGSGSGPVDVDAGRLSGNGVIAGAVTIGNGTSNKGVLSPGVDGVGLLTIQGALTFATNGVYNWNLNVEGASADQVIAAGLVIIPGAKFAAVGRRDTTLPPGTIFTVVDNTSASPINGTFTNLPDDAVIVVSGNNLQASYTGGDGNDLTLTVIP